MKDERIYEDFHLQAMLVDDSEFAFQLLFEKYKDHVYKVARLYVKSPSLAEEILQDVFMKVWLNRKKLAEVKSFESWLYVVSKNVILNYNKRIAAEWKAQLKYAAKEKNEENTTDHKVRDSQLRDLLQKAILSLSPQQQLIYKLAKEENLSYQQIADRLSISQLTVKTHLARALNAIRFYLKSHGDTMLILALISTNSRFF